MRMLAAAMATAVLLLGACGQAGPQSIVGKKRLVIGVRPDLPGIGLRRPDGTFEGFEIDVARYLAGRLGAEVEFVSTLAADRMPFLLSGKADLVIGHFAITQERKTMVSFAGPYMVSYQDLLVRSGERDIHNVYDLSGRAICAVKGSDALENVTQERGVDARTVAATNYGECVAMLLDGRVDAITTNDVILAGLAGSARGGLRLLNTPFDEGRPGVGIRKGDLDGCEALNRAITDMYQDGTAKILMTKWFGGTGLKIPATHVPQFEGCQ
jgi:glutamate transport system substrate-binding protein